ncbi:DotI/IcmL/TraM family protein [Cysteiniphilum sp. JM-1]|uniref:DotI/IcmL/TraM family protein n=1 Tax=Cysteiniphilum sp. JM-1 TaxID=2610891 RepID=UPI001246BE30|nr:DotI/IcmL/TraM family protein [Cysteiniphilum sp. JM-1]
MRENNIEAAIADQSIDSTDDMQTIIHNIVQRNMFYKNAYQLCKKVILLLIAAIILLILFIGYLYKTTHHVLYFATDRNGMMVQLEPNKDSAFSNESVSNWMAQVATTLYQLDFLNIEQQLNAQRQYFAPGAFNSYIKEMEKIVQTVKKDKLVYKASMLNPPEVLADGSFENQKAWKVSARVLVETANKEVVSSMEYTITMVVFSSKADGGELKIAQVLTRKNNI